MSIPTEKSNEVDVTGKISLTFREAKDLLLAVKELDDFYGRTSLSGLKEKIINRFPTLSGPGEYTIADLPLSHRVKLPLLAFGVTTAKELYRMTLPELLDIPGIGYKAVEQIQSCST